MESEYNSLKETLDRLEARIARIEASLHLEAEHPAAVPEDASPREETAQAEALEVRIGQDWFAKLGIVILAVGVGFALTLSYPTLPLALPSVGGMLIAGAIIVAAIRWHNSLHHISGYLLGGGIVLAFVAILRLQFFGIEPAVENRSFIGAMLALLVGISLLISTRRKSPSLVGLCLLLGYGAVLIADSAPVVFAGITLLSIIGILYSLKNQWTALLTVVAALNIVTHLLWFLNSPVLGRSIHLVDTPHANIFFVLLYMLTIATASVWKKDDGEERGVATSVVNGVGGYLLFLFLTLTTFRENIVLSHSIASLVFLAIAILFWVRKHSLYSTFIYAMLGYMAMSVAIIAQFKAPDHFIWLSWQSIVVVSTAVWFRSRFIVVANFFIYLGLFIAYLVLAGTISVITLSFGVVALLSARILNAQKHRLELKTESMRNAYLLAAFGVFPYALYHSVPRELVSLSWLVVALFYYLMSRAVHSIKYRWMALLTLLLTVVRLLAVDSTGLDSTSRVISFIVLGIVLLVISLMYAKRKGKPPDNNGTTTLEQKSPTATAATESH